TQNAGNSQSAGSVENKAVAIPTIEADDVDNYDGCYLPDGGVVFCSTACFTGVPCIDGSGHVCNLYRKAADGQISQLTVEQDHDWNPVLLPNGRILYLRWEYSDLPHGFSRILMHANPDGTNQTEYYGSGSYYPNTMFYARPIPGSSRFAAIVSGHHEIPRVGDLVVFDPSRGRKEADGAVQRIPGAGKPVSPVTLDFPIAQTWPKFTQPFPISETMFLTACQLDAGSPWAIYLVDVFDNMLELARPEKDADGTVYTFQEPTPIRKTERPPVRPDRTNWERQDADVFIADVYYGQGLPNIPRGTVKALRVFTYEFAYQGIGAEPHSVGLDGPWDPKRVLGTVPVYEDGSASFRIPAVTPVAFQALDAEGRAIQLMRSWTTAMPGESVSCTGCHEEQNSVPPAMPSPIASRRPPVDITPTLELPPGSLSAEDGKDAEMPTPYKVRGFSFQREIQPILEKHCIACHDEDSQAEHKSQVSFRNGPPVPAFDNPGYYNVSSRFSPSYYNLRRYVRTPTKESQMPVLKPYEFHVESTILGQILRQGHFGVTLSHVEWATLNTWIDLNAPYYGSWGESRNYAIAPHVKHQYERRLALRKLYTTAVNADADDPSEFPIPEKAPVDENGKPKFPHSDILVTRTAPTDTGLYAKIGTRADSETENGTDTEVVKTVELAPGVTLELVKIPGKEWLLGRCEVTNAQFKSFMPEHNTGVEYADFIHFSPNEAGWLLSRDEQPVARVSATDAEAFCAWLSEKTGMKFTLPSAGEWRYAALARENADGSGNENADGSGTATLPDGFWFGDLNVDYALYENLSDATNQQINPRSWKGRLDALPPWRIADGNVNDRNRVSALVGSYRPNPWGLYDMHGNVSEWTAS
ncbi:MAG: SUMF1/EgtB/PvdO family nonheme iron enzyme, partial [Planctomycetia bacterium]|nr:SUMF1/EgtB/PvdO family nonheme iron enzyme [Planctomycetia bacterium]